MAYVLGYHFGVYRFTKYIVQLRLIRFGKGDFSKKKGSSFILTNPLKDRNLTQSTPIDVSRAKR